MIDNQFLKDVDEGLSATNKFLLSKYFYDEKGDELFVKIMGAPEYYLTNAEHEIFKSQTAQMAAAFGINGESFELVELGAGDGTKTLELLRFLENDYSFSYVPIDISKSALNNLETRLLKTVPNIQVKPQQGEYFKVLHKLQAIAEPKIILFLGSNLGNLLDERAHLFIEHLADSMNMGDKLLLGVDLKKSKDIILPAYNDKAGYTREFNLNLLTRINRELNANFDVDQFEHLPIYDEEQGIAFSYLVSRVEQTVKIGALNKSFVFAKDERIHTEISRKYDDETIQTIFQNTNLIQKEVFTDSNNYFADYLFEKV